VINKFLYITIMLCILSRSYEDEINEISRCLLETGVQHQFPRALEIQLDFTLFNVDEGTSTRFLH
jgi:hypothetical protein